MLGTVGVTFSRSVSSRPELHSRWCPEGVREGHEQRSARWRDRLASPSWNYRRLHRGEDLHHRRYRNWEETVCGLYSAATQGQRRHGCVLRIEVIECRASPDDVDDGVESAQFVKMDLAYVDAVHNCLGPTQCPERRQREDCERDRLELRKSTGLRCHLANARYDPVQSGSPLESRADLLCSRRARSATSRTTRDRRRLPRRPKPEHRSPRARRGSCPRPLQQSNRSNKPSLGLPVDYSQRAHGGPEAVVDVANHHTSGTRVQHSQQRRETVESCSVSHACGNGDHRRTGEASDDARKSPFHAGDDDDGVCLGQRGPSRKDSVEAGHARRRPRAPP